MVAKAKPDTKTKLKKRKNAGDIPTKLQLPSGQIVLVDLQYPNDLEIKWRKDEKKRPLKCRGTRLTVTFPSGEKLVGISKCAPEDNFNKYEGKRDAFLDLIQKDNAAAGHQRARGSRIARHSFLLRRELTRTGLDDVAEAIAALINENLPTPTRDKRNVLLSAADRTALMKYLCPRFAQRDKSATFIVIAETSNKSG